MSEQEKYRFSSTQYREFIELVREKYDFDLSFYAFSIFKRRIENFISKYNIDTQAEALKLIDNIRFFENLKEILRIPSTELFRDFEFWIHLRNSVLPALNDEPVIWVPDITTDSELFTLLIVLRESGIENYKIIATSPFIKETEEYTNYLITDREYEISEANYNKYNDNKNFEQFFIKNTQGYLLKKDFFVNIVFKEFSFINNKPLPSDYDLVLYRNRMIYYSQTLQIIAMEKVYEALKIKGFLAIGAQEELLFEKRKNYSEVIKKCKIYRKKK